MTTPPNAEASRLADQLERSFRGGAWHGPAVTEALVDVDAAIAAAHPVAGAHSIAEIVAHLTTWLGVTRERIEGTGRPVPEEEDWPAAAAAAEDAWRDRLARLEEAHRLLHATVAALTDDRLADPVAGSDPTVRGLLLGVLQHHAYHGGQILLLARAARGGAG